MAVALTTKNLKDASGTTLAFQVLDTISGSGPYSWANCLIDGVAGANLCEVDDNNSMAVTLRASDGTALSFGAGAVDAGTLRVEIASNDSITVDGAITATLSQTSPGLINTQTLTPGTSPDEGVGVLGHYNATLPSPITGQTVGIQVDAKGRQLVSSGPAHDGDSSATYPLMMGGVASSAAPSSVSADGDAVKAWYLRNGAQAAVITAAGALIGGDASFGLDTDVVRLPGQEYETVAASATAQVLGSTGAVGDLINGVVIVPSSTSPGSVVLLDNATSITVFSGGASSVSNLVPFFVPLGIRSVSGAWKLTTGASVSCIGVGDFT